MKLKLSSRPAFTLVELIVVIGIIGILIGVLAASYGNGTDRAKSVKCATNLKALASAVAACAASGYYPYAQSAQYMDNGSTGSSGTDLGIVYNVHRGWIHYLDGGGREGKPSVTYPLKSPGSFPQCSFAANQDDVRYAMSQGAIWKVIGGNTEAYMCPVFKECCRRNHVKSPGWSYQMSALFGYEEESGKALATASDRLQVTSLARADRTLLFGEIQGVKPTDKIARKAQVTQLPPTDFSTGNGNRATDGCLFYKSKGGNESIGFNHCRGRDLVGHVAFADGHVEAIAAPKSGNFVELTDWLCRGLDVVYRDGDYEEIKNSVEE